MGELWGAMVDRGISSPSMTDASEGSEPRALDPARLGDHLDRLHRAAWALCGTRHDADDLVQETYARVLARPRLIRREGDLSYLLRALHNTFISGRRAQRRRLAPDELDEAAERSASAHPLGTEEAAEQRLVYAAIASLPEDFRAALVLVDVAGLSYAEAARALRIREGTLTSRVFRARREAAHRPPQGGQERDPSQSGEVFRQDPVHRAATAGRQRRFDIGHIGGVDEVNIDALPCHRLPQTVGVPEQVRRGHDMVAGP